MSGRNTGQQWKDKTDNFPANCETPMTGSSPNNHQDARSDYSIEPLEGGQRALLIGLLKTPTSGIRSYASVLLSHIFCDIFPTLRILSPSYGFPKHDPMSNLYNTTGLLEPFFQYDCIMVTFNCHFDRIQHHHGNKPQGHFVRYFLNQVN